MKKCLTVFAIMLFATAAFGQEKRAIPIAVRVDSEGNGKSQGMWVQEATDLTSEEVKTLEALLLSQIRKQDGTKIVSMDYQEDFVGLGVVVAKLPGKRPGTWHYVASSAVIVAKKGGADELVTHNVLAESSLEEVAQAIGYVFASVRLRAATGLWK